MKVLFKPLLRWLPSLVPADRRPAVFRLGQRVRFASWHWRVRLGAIRDKPLAHRISLIVATYNVEPYIDEFLRSAIYQSTGRKNLEIILVDDGSTDRSGEIAQRWARRFPDTIRYVHKPNGGASSARNVGLDLATGDWVSFPDPDDVLAPRYLHHVNAELSRKHDEPLLMVAARLLVYREATGRIRDNHPLTYRFRKRRHVGSSTELDSYIHLSGGTAILHRGSVEAHALRFDERVRPTNEDMHFINRLLILEPARSVAFIRHANYIYRRRLRSDSLVASARADADWYTSQLWYGCISLLELAVERRGVVPRFIQELVLYELLFRFHLLVDYPERASLLNSEQQNSMLRALTRCLEFVETDVIQSSHVYGLYEEHRVALIGSYKGLRRQPAALYVHRLDAVRNEVLIGLYTHSADRPDLAARSGEAVLELRDYSRRNATFLGAPYFTEHRFWVSVGDAPLEATFAGEPARFKHVGKIVGDRFDATKALASNAPQPSGAWLFMDREDKADDNAEHLYKYVRQADPSRAIYFILAKSSHDWRRLEDEGFRLLPYRSLQHYRVLQNSSLLLSSHIDHRTLYPFGKSGTLPTQKFVFLQHGVTKDDLSRWLNSKPIDLMVAATYPEYISIVQECSNYLMSKKEVRLTGFPRHDRLLTYLATPDVLLIMPTWRRYLTAQEPGSGGASIDRIERFAATDYARDWGAVLQSERLRSMADQAGLRIVLCTHPNMSIFLDDWRLPKWVKTTSTLREDTIQSLLGRAGLVVTDYSSIAFDTAMMERPVVYFQFDRERMYSGEHTYWRGYFDYERDGFGPVCVTNEEVLTAVEAVLSGQEDPQYAQRRRDTFPFRDGRNCERVYDAVLEMLGETRASPASESQLASQPMAPALRAES